MSTTIKKTITFLAFTATMLCGNIFTANAQWYSNEQTTYSELTETSVKIKFSVQASSFSLMQVRFRIWESNNSSSFVTADTTVEYADIISTTIAGGEFLFETPEITITGLDPGTYYRVITHFNFGTPPNEMFGDFENITYLPITSGDDVKPPTKFISEDIVIGSVTANSLNLTWYQARDNKTSQSNLKYKIYYKAGGSCGSNIVCWETTADGNSGYVNGNSSGSATMTHTLTGLNLLNNTEFNIVVEDEAGNKTIYRRIYVQYVDTQAPQPTTASMITGTITENSIQMSWDRFTDNVTPQNQLQYKPWYIKGSSGVEHSVGRHTDIDTWTFTDLEPNTVYNFGLTVYDETGNWDGIYGGPATTLVATAPTVANKDLTVIQTTSNAIFLSWNEASHAAGSEVKYRVFVSTDESYANSFALGSASLVIIPSWSSNYGLDATSCMITQYFVDIEENYEGILEDLEPGQTYYIAVQAHNAADVNKFDTYNVTSATTADIAPVCEIGSTQYTNLNDAIAAIPAGSTATIKLLDNINHNKALMVKDSVKITFDLNGYDLNVNNPSESDFAAYIYQKSEVYIAGDGEFNITGATALQIGNDCKVTVDNLTANSISNSYGIGITSLADRFEVTVRGNITATNCGIGALTTNSKVTVKGNINVTGGTSATPIGVELYKLAGAIGSEITIDGTLTVATEGKYIRSTDLDTDYPWTETVFTPADSISPTTKPQYFTYTDGQNSVWLRNPNVSGIDELAIDNTQFTVYPNPVSDKLRIDAPTRSYRAESKYSTNNEELRINVVVICDLNGRILKQIENPGSEINVSDLAKGVYFIKIKTDKGETTRKIVKN